MLRVLVVAGGMLGPGARSAAAAFVYFSDEQGANDRPGQRDLTRFGVDRAGLPAVLRVSWNWDTIGLSGANTADACALGDTTNDADLNVNMALCATVGGSPAAQTADSPRLYTCGNGSVDRCTFAVAVAGFASTCSVAQTATDPFAAGESSPQDTTATCTIARADVPEDVTLVNACSYPSQVPNSAPADCVLTPGVPRNGFIVIDPDPAPDDPPTDVPFLIDDDPEPVCTATGSEPCDPIPVATDPPAPPHSIDPDLPPGSHETATCSDGSPLNAVDVSAGETVTCTVHYELPDHVSVTTTPSDDTAPAGSTVTITTDVTDHGPGTAGPITVCVRLPAGTRLVRATRGAHRRHRRVCWHRPSLKPGKHLRLRIKVRIKHTAPDRIVVRVRVRAKGHHVIRRRATIFVTPAHRQPCGRAAASAFAAC